MCYRLWTKGEEGGLAPFPPAEIEVADLAGLALELALWGGRGPAVPDAAACGALAEARALLAGLGALDGAGQITGAWAGAGGAAAASAARAYAGGGGAGGGDLAALLAERDPLRGAAPDLALRMQAVARPGPEADRAVVERIRAEAKRLAGDGSARRRGG